MTPRTRARRAPAAWAALLAATLTACGVPADSEARSIGTAPFDLLSTTTSSAQATTVPPEEGFQITLYWVNSDDQIVPGETFGLPGEPSFQQVVDLLVAGPPGSGTGPNGSTSSVEQGVRTYVTEALNPGDDGDAGAQPATGPRVTRVEGGSLDLLVDDRFRDESQATPTRFRLAIAQVVCTVTQFRNVDEVRFFDSRGQLTLVNLEQLPIEVATRDNIGRCAPRNGRAPNTTSTTSPPTPG